MSADDLPLPAPAAARRAEYMRAYQAKNREKLNGYHRAYMAAKRWQRQRGARMTSAEAGAAGIRIAAVLNIYQTQSGANRCQVLVFTDGSTDVRGHDASTLKTVIKALREIDLRSYRNAECGARNAEKAEAPQP